MTGMSYLKIKNETQVFYAKRLGEAYIEVVNVTKSNQKTAQNLKLQHFFLQEFLNKVNTCTDAPLKKTLTNLLSLYGLFTLQKYLTLMYQKGFATRESPAVLVEDAILKLCGELKDDAVAIVDAISPPDFILNSVLGYSDGRVDLTVNYQNGIIKVLFQVYEHLEKSFMSSQYGTSRPSWWKDMVNWKEFASRPLSKL